MGDKVSEARAALAAAERALAQRQTEHEAAPSETTERALARARRAAELAAGTLRRREGVTEPTTADLEAAPAGERSLSDQAKESADVLERAEVEHRDAELAYSRAPSDARWAAVVEVRGRLATAREDVARIAADLERARIADRAARAAQDRAGEGQRRRDAQQAAERRFLEGLPRVSGAPVAKAVADGVRAWRAWVASLERIVQAVSEHNASCAELAELAPVAERAPEGVPLMHDAMLAGLHSLIQRERGARSTTTLEHTALVMTSQRPKGRAGGLVADAEAQLAGDAATEASWTNG